MLAEGKLSESLCPRRSPRPGKAALMPRLLVIPDVHLKPWIFDLADAAMPQFDGAVVLGDLVDDWDASPESYNACVGRAVQFDRAHPGTLWCLGNHDLAYLCHEDGLRCSGFNERLKHRVKHLLGGLLDQVGDRMRVAHVVDSVIFSHAGLSSAFVHRVRSKLHRSRMTLDDVAAFTNEASPVFLWEDDSPVWFRPRGLDDAPKDALQIAGHTPVDDVTAAGRLVLCDTFSTHPDGTPAGCGSLAFCDTETHAFGRVDML